MEQQDLLELMEKFDRTALTKLCYEKDGMTLTLEKEPAVVMTQGTAPQAAVIPVPAAAPAQQEADTALEQIVSPLVGVFYRAPSPESAPFVEEGQTVAKGDVVCLVEAMKMINEIKSPCAGKIRRICAENEEVISFQQVLFEVEPC